MKDVKTLSLPLKVLYPLIEETLAAGREIYITVRGNSMSPFLRDGKDQAVFASLKGRRVRRGDVVFYQRDNGQFVMHRVYRVEKNGLMTIVGDAQLALETGIRPDQLRAFVPRVVRKGREISCEKGFWHALMRAYMLRIRFPRAVRLAVRIAGLPKKMWKKWIQK